MKLYTNCKTTALTNMIAFSCLSYYETCETNDLVSVTIITSLFGCDLIYITVYHIKHGYIIQLVRIPANDYNKLWK